MLGDRFVSVELKKGILQRFQNMFFLKMRLLRELVVLDGVIEALDFLRFGLAGTGHFINEAG